MSNEKPLIVGLTQFFFETGCEGSFWAVQDKNFIKPNTSTYQCKKCHCLWDMNWNRREGDEPADISQWRESKLGPKAGDCDHDWELSPTPHHLPEGLHILESGDYIKIFSREDETIVLFEGQVDLMHFDVFTENVFGVWIHSEQKSVDREIWASWFITEHKIELIKK